MRAPTLWANPSVSRQQGVCGRKGSSSGALSCHLCYMTRPSCCPTHVGNPFPPEDPEGNVLQGWSSAVLFRLIEPVVLSLTPWHTHWNVLPSAEPSGKKIGPFPVFSLPFRFTALLLGYHTYGCLGYPLLYPPSVLVFTNP